MSRLSRISLVTLGLLAVSLAPASTSAKALEKAWTMVRPYVAYAPPTLFNAPGYFDIYLDNWTWLSSNYVPQNNLDRGIVGSLFPSDNTKSFSAYCSALSGVPENGTMAISATAQAVFLVRVVWRDHTPGPLRSLPTYVKIRIIKSIRRRSEAGFIPEAYVNGYGKAVTNAQVDAEKLESEAENALIFGTTDYKYDGDAGINPATTYEQASGTDAVEYTFPVQTGLLAVDTYAHMFDKTIGGSDVGSYAKAEQLVEVAIDSFVWEGDTYQVWGEEESPLHVVTWRSPSRFSIASPFLSSYSPLSALTVR